MTTSRLADTLERYATALAALEDAAPHPLPEHIMNVLVARDVVKVALADKTPDSTATVVAVIELDDRLKKQADVIARTVKLADWRASFNPSADAWWWSLETLARPHRWDRFDWLLSALTIAFLTLSLSLLVDISSRFLSGGPDTFGAFAVITQSVLTLLAAGGALTKAGREMIERVLASLNIPKYLWHEVKLGFSAFVLLGLFIFRLSLPQIAVFYNNSGLDHYRSGRLASAQFDYLIMPARLS